jgi:hypothetical protein
MSQPIEPVPTGGERGSGRTVSQAEYDSRKNSKINPTEPKGIYVLRAIHNIPSPRDYASETTAAIWDLSERDNHTGYRTIVLLEERGQNEPHMFYVDDDGLLFDSEHGTPKEKGYLLAQTYRRDDAERYGVASTPSHRVLGVPLRQILVGSSSNR